MSSSASFDRDPLAIVLSVEDSVRVTDQDLAFSGELLKTRIATRTMMGIDVDGQPFAPYSPEYAKRKTKSGRNASPVNLSWSGKMLASIKVVVNSALQEVTLVIYGFDEALRAKAHNDGTARLPRRHWFDANALDVQVITKLLQDAIQRRLPKS